MIPVNVFLASSELAEEFPFSVKTYVLEQHSEESETGTSA
jgi:hypothetical protein